MIGYEYEYSEEEELVEDEVRERIDIILNGDPIDKNPLSTLKKGTLKLQEFEDIPKKSTV